MLPTHRASCHAVNVGFGLAAQRRFFYSVFSRSLKRSTSARIACIGKHRVYIAVDTMLRWPRSLWSLNEFWPLLCRKFTAKVWRSWCRWNFTFDPTTTIFSIFRNPSMVIGLSHLSDTQTYSVVNPRALRWSK